MKSSLLVVLALAGCARSFEETPAEPLKCSADVVELPEGSRLRITCNRDVLDPPPECEPIEPGPAYDCNTLHADDAMCRQFPGICK